ncbi:MAG: outer membrane beta-barrel protein [Paludibacteraceae bacterium]|nr:outer membrane beta-barrel protein [Paludibacteraceae bacterium]MBP7679840.1 outer membrane beta-barrel protein [Saprospiraceae bacterium]
MLTYLFRVASLILLFCLCNIKLSAQEAGTWRAGISGHIFNYKKYNWGAWESPSFQPVRPHACNSWGVSLNTSYQLSEHWGVQAELGYVWQQAQYLLSNTHGVFNDTLGNVTEKIFFTNKNISKYTHLKLPLTVSYGFPLWQSSIRLDIFVGVQVSYLHTYYYSDVYYENDEPFNLNNPVDDGYITNVNINENGKYSRFYLDEPSGILVHDPVVAAWKIPEYYNRFVFGGLAGVRFIYPLNASILLSLGYRFEYDFSNIYTNELEGILKEFFMWEYKGDSPRATHNIRQGLDIGVQYQF